MESAHKDGSMRIEIKAGQRPVNAVFFAENGMQVWSGDEEGSIRRWQADDGRKVGEVLQVKKAEIYAAAVSPDGKWLVCGLRGLNADHGTSRVGVWNAQTFEKVHSIKGHTDVVYSVDITSDSTRFATGGYGPEEPFAAPVFIWDMASGTKLVGPLEHDGLAVVAVRFSPEGDKLATATSAPPDSEDGSADPKSIRIYDSASGQLLLDIPFRIRRILSSPLAWSDDGGQLFVTSYGEVGRFDTSSGSLVGKWSIGSNGWPPSIVLSRNQKFAAVVAWKALTFWDLSTHEQIGTTIQHQGTVWSIAFSPDNYSFATGEENGNVTIRSLCDVLPPSYLTVNLSFMYISDPVFKSWTKGDLGRVEELLAEEIAPPSSPFLITHALAQRAIVRTRLNQLDMAIDDAKRSIKTRRSVIAYIAMAIARGSNGEHESAMHAFDLAFTRCLSTEVNILLLIKAVILFECGKRNGAISRVDNLVDIVDDMSVYTTVRAQMLLLLGNVTMKAGDNERAIELYKSAQEAIPFREDPHLVLISLLFGWDFNKLAPEIQLRLCKAMVAVGRVDMADSLAAMVGTFGESVLTEDVTTEWDPDLVRKCLVRFENDGDTAANAKDAQRAIVQYSTALFMNPSNPASLLVKRSSARAMAGLWEDALKDADDAIKADPASPRAYEARHAAMHGLRRYDEAIKAFTHMLSLIEASPDSDVRELAKKYLSPSKSEKIIDGVVRELVKVSPLVLINVMSGHLCDGQKRADTFKSEEEFKELLSSMTQRLDDERIQRVAERYFDYVMFSHVLEGREPSFQDVNQTGSVWALNPSSPLNEKLQKFCEAVRDDGYRWAWSDTCCIDKTVSAILDRSLRMMYKWYEVSAATFVFLGDVESLSALSRLGDSKWMRRACASQELLSPKVVRFYVHDWKPYLGDTRRNHKESPEIMQELADAIGIARETIIASNPDAFSIREKLRVASVREATVEGVPYSLICIFKSDIRPDYGEGDAALGHLLEEIVSRTGEVTVLDWTGRSSSYNSCLPATLAVYSQPPGISPAISDAEMDVRITALRASLSQTDAILIHDRIARLPPVRFANRRLYLPCIVFTVKKLGLQDFGSDLHTRYRAKVPGIGTVEFQTQDRLPLTELRKLVFVHPWICNLRDPFDSSEGWTTVDNDWESDSDPETEAGYSPPSPLNTVPMATMDDHTRALRLIARLQEPFHALLLQQQPNGEFKRIAAEHAIMVSGITERRINFARDVRVEVVEVL